MSKVQVNKIPTYSLPLQTKGNISNAWFSFWAGLGVGVPTGELAVQTVGSSPALLSAPSGGSYMIQGGSTTQIRFSRDGETFYVTGQTQGLIPVAKSDQLEITYTLAPPSVVFVPR